MTQKFIDRDGLKVLWNQVNLKDYPNNETLMAVIDAIDETKADKDELFSKSWNDLTDRPFYENEDGTVVTLDEKYIPDTIARTSNIPQPETSVYDTLITTNKTIVGAINEVNDKLPTPDITDSNKVLTVNSDGTTIWSDLLQPDWEQNDETASDYVKNKPFYSTAITLLSSWDGDTTGLDMASGADWDNYRIGDAISYEDIIGATIYFSDSTKMTVKKEDVYTESSAYWSIYFSNIGSGDIHISSVLEDNYAIFTKSGLYHSNMSDAYITKIVKSDVKTLDKKYLPEHLQFGEEFIGDTLTWDGNMEDRDSVDIYDDGKTFIFLVSVSVPTLNELTDGFSMTLSDGTVIDGTSDRLVVENELVYIVNELPFVVIVPYDNYNLNGLTIKKAGTYFTNLVPLSIYTQSLTIPNYNFISSIDNLDKKYLPNYAYGDIEDRPFYLIREPSDESVILPEITLEFEGRTNIANGSISFELIIGKTYTVTWNGITYENLVCSELEGANKIGASSFDYNDCPILIAANSSFVFFGTSDTATSHTLKIIEDLDLGEISVDSRYVAHLQADWNEENQDNVSFIKNKPTADDALALLAEVGMIDPIVDANGSIYTEENNVIYTL